MRTLLPADLAYIEEALQSAATTVIEAYEDSPQPPVLRQSTPDLLHDSLVRLLALLRHMESGEPGPEAIFEARNIHTLGTHGIDTLADLGDWAFVLRQSQAYDSLRTLTFAMALWLTRNGAEISNLKAVVDALAFVANQVKAPAELERLFQATCEIMDAVDPTIAQDIVHSNPGRPWRILLLNQAIIATRSHQPVLMEKAFQTLTEALPEDAASFFREGMERMDALNYPPPVREVMAKYYQLWGPPKTLH